MFSFDLVEDKDRIEFERFKAERNAAKITYDFRVILDYKDDFYRWLNILSCVEMGITFDPVDLISKEGDTTMYFRIKIAGTKKAKAHWLENIKRVLDFFNTYGDITYLKFAGKE